MAKVKTSQKNHRALELLDTLRRLGGSARTSHLADTMNVSEETVRRTVKKLSKDGMVSRVHGGVFLAGETEIPSFHQRLGERSGEKKLMAARIAAMVESGSSVFLDVGSTTTFVAEALRVRENLLVVTNSLTVAQTLMGHNGNKVYLAGGELYRNVSGAFGAATIDYISQFHLEYAVLSVDAFDAEVGFSLVSRAEAELARAFVAQAKRCMIVADHTKAKRTAPMVSCDPKDVDIFVTDKLPDPATCSALKSWGIELLVASKQKKKK